MRWLLLALFTATLLGCPPKDVPDPPAVGAAAKDGQKARQPPRPTSAQTGGIPLEDTTGGDAPARSEESDTAP